METEGSMSRPTITLTTDFGQADGYVGAMKGVMLRICPQAVLVDVTHAIPPQAVQQAAYVLSTAIPYFPPGAVHLAVVDPGVGSERRPIVVQTERAVYVAPDNGLLTMVLAREPVQMAVHLTEPSYRLSPVSDTFHGRDIFAPAAAHLASGIAPRKMGEEIAASELISLPLLMPVPKDDDTWLGQVLHLDSFGNIITSLACSLGRSGWTLDGVATAELGPRTWIEIGKHRVEGVHRTFAQVEPGAWIAYVGSSGYLEVGIRDGNAAAQLGAKVGYSVRIGW
jgi:S-adenosylmethionine hydrolase